ESFFFFFSSRRRHTRLVSDWSSDVCSSDLPPLSGYALAGSPPFGLGHVRLRVPICQARREPILGRAPLHGLNLLDRLFSRRRIGKLGSRRQIDKNAQKGQTNDVQRAHELGLTILMTFNWDHRVQPPNRL